MKARNLQKEQFYGNAEEHRCADRDCAARGCRYRDRGERPHQEADPPAREEAKLKAERVQEKLLSMPGWRISADGKGLIRVRVFQDNKTAMAFTGFANTATESSGHLAHITLSGPRVLMTLQSRARHGGFTEALFDFAKDLG
jgi:pterin-4a-carbinolamine dehydratase